MKFKFVEDFDLDEKFTSNRNKYSHYNKHVNNLKEYDSELTEEEYEKIADDLAMTKLDHKRILGYETESPDDDNRHRYAKYNKDTGDFVVYALDSNKNPLIISLHKKTIREYNIDKGIKYVGEIPE